MNGKICQQSVCRPDFATHYDDVRTAALELWLPEWASLQKMVRAWCIGIQLEKLSVRSISGGRALLKIVYSSSASRSDQYRVFDLFSMFDCKRLPFTFYSLMNCDHEKRGPAFAGPLLGFGMIEPIRSQISTRAGLFSVRSTADPDLPDLKWCSDSDCSGG